MAQFTKGIIDGSKTVSLKSQDNKSLIDVEWDIKLTGLMGMFTGMVKKHIKDGTDLALQSINCLLYTSPSPRDKRQSRMPSSA